MTFNIAYGENYLSIEPLGFSYPDDLDPYTRNLISTRILLKAGKFHGDYVGEFETADYENFKEGLLRLKNNLNSFARFDGLEPYLTLKMQGDGLGHFKCDCSAIHNPGFEQTELTFVLHFDQTQLPELIKQIDSIMNEFPIKK
jgi:hypothetical protein